MSNIWTKRYCCLLLNGILAFLTLQGCDQDNRRVGRERYNAGVAALAKNDFATAQTELLAARDKAVGDPDLLFRANYNLGLAYIQEGDRKRADKDPDSNQALTMYENAIGWLRDAVKLRAPQGATADGDSDELTAAKQNLVTVLAKKAALIDELAKGERKLEARLDAVIATERRLWAESQQAWQLVKRGQGQDPLAGRPELIRLASEQRGASAEAGVVGDLAADEIDAIGKKAEDKRTPDEQVRVIVLKNLDLYLLEARARMAEARRKFQELAAEAGVARAESAVAALKRAKEQLMDPIAVLRAVGQDQIEQLRQTALLSAAQESRNQVKVANGSGASVVEPSAEQAQAMAEMAQLPWFAPEALQQRQSGMSERLAEVQNRLSTALQSFEKQQAAASAPNAPNALDAGSAAPPPVAEAPKPADPKQVKLMANVKRALPLIETAASAMTTASTEITASRFVSARKSQIEVITNIARAVEEFSDMRQVIELMHGEQNTVAQLLGPAGAQVPGNDRGQQTRDGLRKNAERAERLTSLMVDELADAKAKLQAEADKAAAQMVAPAPTAAGSAAASDPKADLAKQLTELTSQYDQAQVLRSSIATLVAQSQKEIETGKDPLPSVTDTKLKIEELRRLFFSVIEHLKELITAQGETRDQTVAAASKDESERKLLVPGIVPKQVQHSVMAQAIAQALAAQADANTSKAGAEPGKEAGEGKRLGEAAAEMKLADTEMTTAKTGLDKVLSQLGVSVTFDPMTEAQGKAVEHLQKALAILEPPKQQNQDQQQQDQQQQEQKDKDKNKDKSDKGDKQPDAGKDKADKQPPGSAGQRARDKEAERSKKRRDQQQSREAPVDKDW
jgi:hypothetical protein